MFWGGAVLLLGIWRTGENTKEQGNNRELGGYLGISFREV